MNSSLKKKLNKQTFLGIALVGLVVVLAFYMLVFKEYEMKTQELVRSNQALKQEVRVLQNYAHNADSYREVIDECFADINQIVIGYPEVVVEEDIIMLAKQLEDRNTIRYGSILMNEKESMYTVSKDLIAACDIGEGSENQVFERKPAVYTSMTDYEGLKGSIRQIQNFKYRVGIEKIAFQKNEEKGELEGEIDLNFYSMTGTGLGGMNTKIKDYQRGTDDIFKLEQVIADDSEEEATQD